MVTLPAPARKRFSPDAYYRMGELGLLNERCELIDGEIFDMPPIGPGHSKVSTKLRRILESQIPAGFHVREGQPLDLGVSQPQPDLAVVEGTEDDYETAHPTVAALVVEVADSSLEFDRKVKAPLYARAGILECWIVDLSAKGVFVLQAPTGGGFERVTFHGRTESLTPVKLPSVTVTLSEII